MTLNFRIASQSFTGVYVSIILEKASTLNFPIYPKMLQPHRTQLLDYGGSRNIAFGYMELKTALVSFILILCRF